MLMPFLRLKRAFGALIQVLLTSLLLVTGGGAWATSFTTTVPGLGISIPSAYPEAGGIVIVMVGVNGQVYFQFSDPTGAFRGFQSNGQPAAFRGNPFTVNNPIPLDCGITTCTDYFGGAIAEVHVRFTAYDGDTQPGGFDENDISLILNGINVGSWSGMQTEATNLDGTQSFGFGTGFGNQTFDTGWFSSSNPALMSSLLTTGQTTTQVFDDDPNDNYWDFRRGPSLANEELRTVAPGYTMEKTTTAGGYTAVGQTITYNYVVTNIGSVDIFDLEIADDKVAEQGGTASCNKTTIRESTSGGTADFATCSATYVITQEDIDNGTLTNVAQATGRPAHGTLGAVSDEVTLNGPAANPDMTITKLATPQSFSLVGEVITYDYVLTNTGNTTLTGLTVADNKIPSLSCTAAELLPGDTLTCQASYTVTQADLDAFALGGTPLQNTATATGRDRGGASLTRSVNEDVTGPAAAPAMVVTKSALQGNFDAEGDVLEFRIEVTNTGNVTWPAAPAVTDPLVTGAGGSVSCPAGPIAPLASVVCTANYTVTQPDVDRGEVENTASASITVGGQTVSDTDDVTVPALQTTGLMLDKQLRASSATSFDAENVVLQYDYILTNTGNVTLDAARITDDRVAVTCPPGDIAPGASLTCTSADYLTTQNDLDAGEVTNTATAAADDPDNAEVSSAEDSLTVLADQMPELTMDKQAPVIAAVDFFEGQTITYTYQVTNSGNVTITDPISVSDDKFPSAIACGTADLAPGGVRTCQAVYTVTAADEANGLVTNSAFATDGTTTSNTDTETVPQAGTDAITLDKVSLTPSVNATTDTITYEFTVTNTGDRSIATSVPITINDPKLSNVTCNQTQRIFPVSQGTPNSFTCTGTYQPTQAELDAGEVENTATASFVRPNGGNPITVTSPQASATVPVDIIPSFTLNKIPPASFGVAGDVITYTFEVTNDTAQTIASATVTDPLIPSLVCTLTDIAPFGTQSCTGTYTVTQADVDAESISNTATATGTGSTGAAIPPRQDTAVTPINPAAAVKSMSLSKTADLDPFTNVGDVITYTLAVANTGTQTLENITVTDASLGYTCTIASLAPATSDDTTCRVSYTVQQSDLDAGQIANSATATAPGTPSVNSSVTVPAASRDADFTVVKSADDTIAVTAGQTITYSYVVTNTGNVTLSEVALTDQHTSASGTTALSISGGGLTGPLAPGASTTLTASYLVTQDDIDAGEAITNIVSATGTPPSGVPSPTDTDTETVNPVTANPVLRVVKAEDDGSGTFGGVSASESYSFEVFNDGNVTLSNLVLSDDLTGFSCTLPDLAPGTSTVRCANNALLSDTHTVSQDDVDARFLVNTVSVNGQTPSGAPISASDSVTLDGPTQAPAISMMKTATSGAGFAAVGDVVTYNYVVRNDGNVTITAPITISDNRVSVSCPATPAGGIAPGATLICTATDTVTQIDLNTGSITNTATASVTQPVVPDTVGGPTTVTSTSAPQTEVVPGAQSPSLAIDKTVLANTPSTYAAPGDTVTFAYTVTNNGNVTITDPIQITDNRIAGGAPQACSGVDLAPGDSVTCQLVWTATQPDIDAGSVTNTASPVSTFGGNPVPAGSDTATVTAVQTPALGMDKQLVGISNNSFAAGEVVTYRYIVSNTGNTTVTTAPTVTDNLIPSAAITLDAPFPAGGLLPGGSVSYTATYTLTIADIQLGSVTNNATASTPEATSPPDTVTTPSTASPALTVDKQAVETSFTAVGDVINYTYEVTNTSSGTPAPAFANPITVTDDKVTVTCPPTPNGQLQVGESLTCTAQYTVVQADLDAVSGGQPGGFVTNVASAETVFAGQPIQSPSDSVTVPAVNDPALTVAKSVAAAPSPTTAGDTITYGILTSNSGDTTISGVLVTDPMLATLSCFLGTSTAGTPVAGSATLAPGETLYCEGDYTVTQADIDAQTLSNTATATGSTPAGDPISSTGSVTAPLDPADPEVTVVKALTTPASSPVYTIPGEDVSFTITVRNTGNITLNATTVTDDLVPGSCAIGALAPGEEDSTCTFTYTVTQTDIDNGSFTNTATASSVPAHDPGNPISGSGDIIVPGPDAAPALSLTKDADLSSVSSVGQVITYSYTVANIGNVTLFAQPQVTDDRVSPVSCPALPASGLAPGDFIVCTGTDTVTQPDLDAGQIVNVASASSTEVPFDPSDPDGAQATETVPVDQGPSFTIDKRADDTTGVTEGQVITYSYDITNTGNVTLSNVTLSDTHNSASGSALLGISNGGVVASLVPGQSVTLTASYTVTQEDIDAGADLTNTVSATATPPNALPPVTQTDDETVTVASPDPELTVLKTVSANTGSTAGDTVTFEIDVENTGNVTLTSVSLSDTLRDGSGALITPAPVPTLVSGDGVTLSVGETWVYRIEHVLTQSDVDSGGLSNSARAVGTDPFGTQTSDLSDNGTPVDGDDTPTGFSIPAAPAMDAQKRLLSTGTSVGDTAVFGITLENTGNVTLSSVGILSETLERNDGTPLTLTSGPDFTGADMGSSIGTLQVGETASYLVRYVLTQADIDAGGIRNSAVGQGSPPSGAPVTDTSDNGTPANGTDDPTRLDIAPAPAFSFDKQYTTAAPTFSVVGDELTYSFVLENTGNITLTDPIVIDDPTITDAGGTISCPVVSAAAPWPPLQTRTCTASYFVTQDDLDAGQVDNSATATVGSAPQQSDGVTVPAQQNPAMTLDKMAVSVDPATEFFVGAEISYTYTTTNTGNVTITQPITVTDNLIPAADITCPPFPAAGIAPGATYICTGLYTVTAADVDFTTVTNLASASDGTTTTPLVTETIPNAAVPALELVKELLRVEDAAGDARGSNQIEAVGDRVFYRFTLENTGALALVNDIVINDARLPAPLTCFAPSASDPDFRPAETITCDTPLALAATVTQADLDAGELFNEAIAETMVAGLMAPVISAPATQTTDGAGNPMLAFDKTVTPGSYAMLGDVLTYGFEVRNTGNQTLTDVTVTDPLLPNLTCTAATMAPGDVLTCAEPYTVNQADIDRGLLDNSASVGGIDPGGDAVPSVVDTATATGPASDPLSLTLVKSASPTPFGAAGSVVMYGFEVSNPSIFTLYDIEITDALIPSFSCVIPELAPGASDATSCAVSYTVTQDDVDAGEILNTASATARDLNDTRSVTVTDDLTTAGQPRVPALEATKTADVTILAPGEFITYTLQVANTGNVTLNIDRITDTMSRISTGAPTFLTTPFAYQSGDTDGDGLVDLDEVWSFTATYEITQSDLNAGGVQNSVTVTADGPAGSGSASDVSDDGNDGDGNATDDPTVVEITRDPRLDVVKTVLSTGDMIGDTVTFEIRARNIGNVDITNLSVTDTLSDGNGAVIGTPTPVAQGPIPDPLSPGGSVVWTVSHVLTASDLDSGGLLNTASVSGVGPAPGNPVVTDVSDDGDDTDGDTESDPTRLTITPQPGLEVTKTSPSQTTPPTAAGEVVTFTIDVVNTGNVTLANTELTDTLTRADGTVLSPDSISPTGAVTLPAGDTHRVTVVYTLTQDDIDAGGIQNTATATGTTPLGLPVTDVSDDGDDTDGNPADDPTVIAVPTNSALVLTKTAGTPTRINATLFEVIFTITAENTGNVTQADIVLNDDLRPFVAPATLQSVGVPSVSGFTTGSANTGYNGTSDISTLTPGASLAPGATGEVVLTVRYDVAAGAPAGVNTATLTSDRIAVPATATASVGGSETLPDLTAAKRVVSTGIVQRGSTVTYELTFENNNTSAEAGLTFVDRLPAGMVYLPGSATFDGGATPAPIVTGRMLEWRNQTLAPSQRVTIRISARLLDGVGEYTNTAYILDGTGAVVSNVAEATVRVAPEAVFDCSDVIGKVFDDIDGDGYQDPPQSLSGITDQDIFQSKLGKLAPAEITEQGGEPGLPGVRLVTPRGDIITTDRFGRYSVPCAELPQRKGSNFVIKLDTRSLPTGYNVTTENPRVLRLTPGKMAELNFGASLSNLVEIDLTARAFAAGGAPSAALVQGLKGLAAQLKTEPSAVRLRYLRVANESVSTARARLKEAEAALRKEWRGPYDLRVERSVQRLR